MYTLKELLLQLGLGNLDLNGLVNLLGMSALVVCVVLDCGREEGIYEGRFSQPRFSRNLNTISTQPTQSIY
jgi:hypothetical protein